MNTRARSYPTPASILPGGIVGDIAKFMISRAILKRVVKVGGVQGMLLSAAATYALDRYVFHRRR